MPPSRWLPHTSVSKAVRDFWHANPDTLRVVEMIPRRSHPMEGPPPTQAAVYAGSSLVNISAVVDPRIERYRLWERRAVGDPDGVAHLVYFTSGYRTVELVDPDIDPGTTHADITVHAEHA